MPGGGRCADGCGFGGATFGASWRTLTGGAAARGNGPDMVSTGTTGRAVDEPGAIGFGLETCDGAGALPGRGMFGTPGRGITGIAPLGRVTCGVGIGVGLGG